MLLVEQAEQSGEHADQEGVEAVVRCRTLAGHTLADLIAHYGRVLDDDRATRVLHQLVARLERTRGDLNRCLFLFLMPKENIQVMMTAFSHLQNADKYLGVEHQLDQLVVVQQELECENKQSRDDLQSTLVLAHISCVCMFYDLLRVRTRV